MSKISAQTCKLLFVLFIVSSVILPDLLAPTSASAAAPFRYKDAKTIVSTYTTTVQIPPKTYSIDTSGTYQSVSLTASNLGSPDMQDPLGIDGNSHLRDYLVYKSDKSHTPAGSQISGQYYYILVQQSTPATGYLVEGSSGGGFSKISNGITIDNVAAGPKAGAWVKIGYYLAFPSSITSSTIHDAEPWEPSDKNDSTMGVTVTDDLGTSQHFNVGNLSWDSNMAGFGAGYQGVWINDAQDDTWLRPGGNYNVAFYLEAASSLGVGTLTGSGKSVSGSLKFSVDSSGKISLNYPFPATSAHGDGITASGANIYTASRANPQQKVDIAIPAEVHDIDAVTKAIASVLAILVTALQSWIQTMGQMLNSIMNLSVGMMQGSAIQNAWSTVLKVTLSLLTLALLIIAFANILNVDEKLGYGVNGMIPKIIMAIGMAYFSFLVCRVLLDLASAFQSQLFNLQGVGVTPGTIITKSLDNPSIFGSATAINQGISQGLFILILFLVIFLASLWLVVLMVVRIAVLWILIALAPAAMLMNILPFTQDYNKQWWTEWWKWLFMGPAVALMLYLSGAVMTSYITAFSSGSNLQAWILLIVSAVTIFMAGTIPLTMGGKVYSTIQNAGKKAQGYAKTGDKYLNKSRGTNFLAGRRASIDARNKTLAEKQRLGVAVSGKPGASFLSGVSDQQRTAAEDKYIGLKAETMGMNNMNPAGPGGLQDLLTDKDPYTSRAAARELASRKMLASQINSENAQAVSSMIEGDAVLAGKVAGDNKDVSAALTMNGATKKDGTTWEADAQKTMQKTAPQDWSGDQWKMATSSTHGAASKELLTAMIRDQKSREKFFESSNGATKAMFRDLMEHDKSFEKKIVDHLKDVSRTDPAQARTMNEQVGATKGALDTFIKINGKRPLD